MGQLSKKSSLTEAKSDAIAHMLAGHFVRKNLHLEDNGEYRRRLGQLATELDGDLTVDQLHEFVLEKLPRLIGKMFGWNSCSIEGTSSDRQRGGDGVS